MVKASTAHGPHHHHHKAEQEQQNADPIDAVHEADAAVLPSLTEQASGVEVVQKAFEEHDVTKVKVDVISMLTMKSSRCSPWRGPSIKGTFAVLLP